MAARRRRTRPAPTPSTPRAEACGPVRPTGPRSPAVTRQRPPAGRSPSRIPPRCPARTRAYRSGVLIDEGFPVAELSDHLDTHPDTVVWFDLHDASTTDLEVITEEFGLHPAGGRGRGQRAPAPQARPLRRPPVPGRLRRPSSTPSTGRLATSEIAAFITPRALITVRKDDGFDIDALVGRLGREPRPGRPRRRLPAARAARPASSTATSPPCSPSTTQIEDLQDLLFADTGRAHRPAAAQLRAAQEPGPAAPGRAAHARGRQHPHAPRPAPRRRRP